VLAIAPSLLPNLAYDPLRDLAPVTLGVKAAEILAVAPSLRATARLQTSAGSGQAGGR
jgi:hypothetical protein